MTIAALIGVLRIGAPSTLERLDMSALDLRHVLRGVRHPSGDVVVVAIDDESMSRFGAWPWPRARVAELIQRLDRARPKTIALDVVMNRPDDGDAALAAAMAASQRVVIGQIFGFGSPERASWAPADRALFRELAVRSSGSVRPGALREARTVLDNTPPLSAAAAGVGYLNFFPDPDGAFRRATLAIRVGDRLAPSFAVEVARRDGEGVAANMETSSSGAPALRIGAWQPPIDGVGDIWIDYLGPAKTFPYVSASTVLTGQLEPAELTGKVVIIGPDAPGYDRLSNPFSAVVAGAEVHATVVDNILHDRSLFRPAWLWCVEVAIVLGLGALVAVGLHFLHGVRGPVAGLGLTVIYVSGTQLLFNAYGLVLSAVYPLAAVVLSTLGGTTVQYVIAQRARTAMRTAFGRYVDPDVVEQIASDPGRLKPGGEEREVSILFSDIRGFTSHSENMPARVLFVVLNDYFQTMTALVFKYRGLLDKYIGDAIMAVWGTPLPMSDHASNACRTALDMLDAVPVIRERLARNGWTSLEIGIGIDTGVTAVGNFGSSERFNYTVIGEHVNVASRLEALNKEYGTHALITDATRRAVGDEFVCRELDWVCPKGIAKVVTIHELVARNTDDRDGRLRHLAQEFGRALEAYRRGAFADAVCILQALVADYPDDAPTRRLLWRSWARREAAPPEEWDGVYRPEAK